MQKEVVQKLLEAHDCFYLYDEGEILRRVERLKGLFPMIEFLYSVKCNPHRRVLDTVFSRGFGADAASLNEVLSAREAGLPAEKIYYSAPGKSLWDLEHAWGKCVLIADCLGEVHRISAIAADRGEQAEIGLRLNPDFTFRGDGGAASKFGVDEEQALAFLQNGGARNVRITGLHVHVQSQELSAETLAGYYRRLLAMARKFETVCGKLDYVNMGSGMGVPFGASDRELDVERLSALAMPELEAFQAAFPDTRLIIETGRYVTCQSGVYVTTVADRKDSRGKTYVILKNTLNGFLRPAVASMAARSGLNPPVLEPLFTTTDAFQIHALKEEPPTERVTLAGNLCTGTDVIAEDILMPHLEPGDAVWINNAGSYAASFSPMQFASQEKPEELFLTTAGEVL